MCLNWMADTKVIPAPRPASNLELPVRKEREAEEAANTKAWSILTLASDNTDTPGLWVSSQLICVLSALLQNAEE